MDYGALPKLLRRILQILTGIKRHSLYLKSALAEVWKHFPFPIPQGK